MLTSAVAIGLLSAIVAVLSGSVRATKTASGGQQQSKTWAVLVAGNSEWDHLGYAIESDVSHAYQVLHRHGIPDENIVVMMADDIAFNEANPLPGRIVNYPDGENVYAGVPKDYTNNMNTPENFLKVLQGIPTGVGSGKVINSTADDNIFVYFADHGDVGKIFFPNWTELQATQLNRTLHKMHKNNRYSKLVFYLLACYSGSMFFKSHLEKIDAFAVTAAKPTQSAYPCYYDSFLDTFISSEFGRSWTEDADNTGGLENEDFLKQFERIEARTLSSQVQAYGLFDFGEENSLAEFMGTSDAKPFHRKEVNCTWPGVSMHDAHLHSLTQRATKASGAKKEILQAQLSKLHRRRNAIDAIFAKLAMNVANGDMDLKRRLLYSKIEIDNFDCYYNLSNFFDSNCFNRASAKNHYALKFSHLLVNICEERLPMKEAEAKIRKTCSNEPLLKLLV